MFQKQEIRRQLYNGEWWFVINDVIAVLTDSTNPAQYLRNMRNRDAELAELMEVAPVDKGVVQIEHPLVCCKERLTFHDIALQTCFSQRPDIDETVNKIEQ